MFPQIGTIFMSGRVTLPHCSHHYFIIHQGTLYTAVVKCPDGRWTHNVVTWIRLELHGANQVK